MNVGLLTDSDELKTVAVQLLLLLPPESLDYNRRCRKAKTQNIHSTEGARPRSEVFQTPLDRPSIALPLFS